jgi:hypothetical protein
METRWFFESDFFTKTQTWWFFECGNFHIPGTDGSLNLKFFYIPRTGQVLQKSNTGWNPAKKYAKEMSSTNIQAVFCFSAKFRHVVTEEMKGAANPTKDFL